MPGAEPVAFGWATRGEGIPFEPLEVRAAETAASMLEELAELDGMPGCSAPSRSEALEALDAVRVALWRGPTEGRVRVSARIGCAPREPGTSSSPRSRTATSPGPTRRIPLLGDERRARLELRALARRDAVLEERYLFHACVSRPTERLWLSWRSSTRTVVRAPAPRSSTTCSIGSRPVPEEAERRAQARSRGSTGWCSGPTKRPSRRQLERAVAALAPRVEPVLPGPLADPAILAELAERDPVGAGTLETWIECPYRWFVDHELRPQRLEPKPEAMRAGSDGP